MSKSHLQEGAKGFTPVTLTIELTKQGDVDALYWLTSTTKVGLSAMKEARSSSTGYSCENIQNTAYKLVGYHLSPYAYQGK